MAYVLGDALDRKRIVAADLLMDSLMGSNEAPVKKAIMRRLGRNVTYYTAGDMLQPYGLIMLQNAKPQVARRFARSSRTSAAAW